MGVPADIVDLILQGAEFVAGVATDQLKEAAKPSLGDRLKRVGVALRARSARDVSLPGWLLVASCAAPACLVWSLAGRAS